MNIKLTDTIKKFFVSMRNNNKQQTSTKNPIVAFSICYFISHAREYWFKNNLDISELLFRNDTEIRLFEVSSKWILALSKMVYAFHGKYLIKCSNDGVWITTCHQCVRCNLKFEYNNKEFEVFFNDVLYNVSNSVYDIGKKMIVEVWSDELLLVKLYKSSDAISFSVYKSDMKIEEVIRVFEEGMRVLFEHHGVSPKSIFELMYVPAFVLPQLAKKYNKIKIDDEDSLKIQMNIPLRMIYKLLDKYAKKDEVLSIYVKREDIKLVIEFILENSERSKQIENILELAKKCFGENVIIKYKYEGECDEC